MERFLRAQIEKDLFDLGPAFTQDEYELKVAAIKFGKANAPLIELLKERGTYLLTAPERLPYVEEKIKVCMEKNNKRLQRPVCAFVTFTTQEAKERIAKWRIAKNEDGSENEFYTKFNQNSANHFKSLG